MVSGFAAGRRALVQGASRGLGLALVEGLLEQGAAEVIATCREPARATALGARSRADPRLTVLTLDVADARSVAAAASAAAERVAGLDLLINCAGVLHEGETLKPERRLAEVRPAALRRAFDVNALGPLLVAQAFEALLARGTDPVFAAVSARVGSIADNRLGGWYAYRMSKAALNMAVRTLAIEWARRRPPIRALALHPGTVDTELSAPFRGTRRAPVRTSGCAARDLLDALSATPAQTGRFLAWDGREIPW